MPIIRDYIDNDWVAVREVCLLAFTPVHESFERLLGTELFVLVYPDWRESQVEYLYSLTEGNKRECLLVAEVSGLVVGFIHYEIDGEERSGKIGLNAVHPAHQGKGIGTLLYSHVLDLMRSQGMKYARVDTGGDPSHASARRAYEKVAFLPVPVVHYFKSLVAAEQDPANKAP